ncbi:MAG TPA: 5'-3' exonuclease H3TH domain-containing protein, partial [Tepidisphaeraceae bacterium]|nr:5'-3' exonuclease H3TH domain-containing protein [Tepidisphaeraceae bacterium]
MPKSFYIIDGHGQLFRAYYAPFRDLTSPTGEPTKATFVFVQMLLNLIQQRKPDYLAMTIDSSDSEVFRREIYPEYKANRKEAPEDFAPQAKRILQVVADAGVPIFVKHGFEADDLMATMARKLTGQDFEVFIVSKDKDLRQIMNERTHLYDVQANEVLRANELEAKVGYTPAQAIEIQTLMGDNIDNVPGIPGVGEKTACKLIKQYGTAEAILQHLDDLTPKLRENFEKFGNLLPITRQLVTLKTDVEFDFDPVACEFKGLNIDALRKNCVELGFKNLVARLDQLPGMRKPETFAETLFSELQAPAVELQTHANCTYSLIDTEEKFKEFIKELSRQERFAFDTETDALGAMQSNLIGMSFSWKAGCGHYVPVLGPVDSVHLSAERVLKDLRPILANEKIKKVGHNLKYDLAVMRQAGAPVRGVEMDSMIAAFVLDASRMQYGIDRLAEEFLKFKKIATAELIGKGKNQISMVKAPLDQVATYASEDADIAWRLYEYLSARLKEIPELQKLSDEVETPLIDVLVDMEASGIAIDPAVLKEQSLAMGEQIADLRDRICKAAE